MIFCYSLHEALAPGVLAGKQVVIDEVGGEQFVERLKVALCLAPPQSDAPGLCSLRPTRELPPPSQLAFLPNGSRPLA